jgi:hypothetical protein
LNGWQNKGGPLEACLEIFVNGYFMEIVKQLKNFFNNQKLMSIKVGFSVCLFVLIYFLYFVLGTE